jgi:hypothetical protein
MALPAIALALLASTAKAEKYKAREHYKHAMAEYVLDHYDAAIKEFEAGFREEPDPAFLYNIAQAHRLANRPAEAITYYGKYLDLRPDAADRAEVEKQIAELSAKLAAALAAPPATDGAAPGRTPAADTGAPAPAAVERRAPVAAPPAAVAPAGVDRPVPVGAPPAAVAPAALPSTEAASVEEAPHRSSSRWKMWLGIAAGGVALAGLGVGLAIAYTTPNDAAIPGTSFGNVAASFH